MTPQKVVILGISGAGKSHLARKLSKALNLPIIHYDTLCWDKNWVEVKEEEVAKKLKEEMKKDKWILEGYILPLAHDRLEQADLILYLDYSGARAMWGGIRRWFKNRGRPLPELAEGCIMKFDMERFKIMWTRDERKEIEREISGFEKKVIRLRSPRELSRFLHQMKII